MKKSLVLLSLLLLFLIGGCSELIDAETQQVTIERVVDGDTLIVEFEDKETESIRLLLIDTPESVHPEKETQPFGEEASEFAKNVLQEGQDVELEIGDPQRDKYDRMLGYIWVDGENFNQMMIEEGYARVAFVYEPNTKYLEDFQEAENRAKEEGVNIWSIDGYVESQFEEY